VDGTAAEWDALVANFEFLATRRSVVDIDIDVLAHARFPSTDLMGRLIAAASRSKARLCVKSLVCYGPRNIDAAAVARFLLDLGEFLTWADKASVEVRLPTDQALWVVHALTLERDKNPQRPHGAGVRDLRLDAPGPTLSQLLGALVLCPQSMASLQLFRHDNAEDNVLVWLPGSTSNLAKLTIQGRLASSIRGLSRFPDYVYLSSGYTQRDPPANLIHASLLGANTHVRTYRPLGMPPLERRVKSILYTGPFDVPFECNYRARLIDVRSARVKTIHCDAVVVAYNNDCDVWCSVIAPRLLVVCAQVGTRGRNDWYRMPLSRAWAKYPAAKAVQVKALSHIPVAMFRDNRLPVTLSGLVDLAIALGIPDDDGAKVKSKLRTIALVVSRLPVHSVPGVKAAMVRQVIYDTAGTILPYELT